MRALIQRVLEAKVVVEGQITGEIQHGLLVFLGLGKEDTLEKGQKLIDKILKYRIFDDEQGKMGWNVSQAKGGLLLVSQFTLMAQTQKGLRPDFGPAMPPAEAKAVYEQLRHKKTPIQGVFFQVGLFTCFLFDKCACLTDFFFYWLWHFWWNQFRCLVEPNQQAKIAFHFNAAILHACHECRWITFH